MLNKDLWKQDEWTDSKGYTHHSDGITSYEENGTTIFSDGTTLRRRDSGLLEDGEGDLFYYNSSGRLVKY